MKERILQKIRERKLTMRPRAYFVLRMLALVFVSCLILIVSVFIFNFIFFTMRVSGHGSLLHAGFAGFKMFLILFPWLLLAVDILLIILLERLLHRFRFAYKQPLLYLFFGLLAFAISVGLFIDRSSNINDRLLYHADRNHLPGPMNDFYRGARRLPPKGFEVGF